MWKGSPVFEGGQVLEDGDSRCWNWRLRGGAGGKFLRVARSWRGRERIQLRMEQVLE